MNNQPDDSEMMERLLRWWDESDRNPRSMDLDLLEWLITHHPEAIKVRVNREYFDEKIKELEAQGVEITPHMFPGITIYKKIRVKDFEEESSTN